MPFSASLPAVGVYLPASLTTVRSSRTRMVMKLKCSRRTTGHCYFRPDCWSAGDCWRFCSGWVLHLDWFCYNPRDWWSLDCNPCCSWLTAFGGNLSKSWNDPLSPMKFPYRFRARTSQGDAKGEPWSRDRLATELWQTEVARVSPSSEQPLGRSRNIRHGICLFPDSRGCDAAGTLWRWFQGCLLGKWCWKTREKLNIRLNYDRRMNDILMNSSIWFDLNNFIGLLTEHF